MREVVGRERGCREAYLHDPAANSTQSCRASHTTGRKPARYKQPPSQRTEKTMRPGKSPRAITSIRRGRGRDSKKSRQRLQKEGKKERIREREREREKEVSAPSCCYNTHGVLSYGALLENSRLGRAVFFVSSTAHLGLYVHFHTPLFLLC